MPSPPTKMKILSILEKNCCKKKLNFSRGVQYHKKTKVCLKYFSNGCRKIPQRKSCFGNIACYRPGTLLKMNWTSIFQSFSLQAYYNYIAGSWVFLIFRRSVFILELAVNSLDIGIKENISVVKNVFVSLFSFET